MPDKLMQAAFLTEPRKVEFRKIPRPEPGPGEVRVRMKVVSICGSDIHLYKGDWETRAPYPIRPGHEGVGYIDALGDGVTHLDLGQRVVIEPNFPCGQCRYCWRGQGNICPNKRIMGVVEPGCFAEYSILPAQFAWPLPEPISDEDAVLAEPTTVGWHALQTANLQPGDAIAVIGLGAIGLLLTHIALAVGYNVVVNDRVLEKMTLAEQWGATAIRLKANEEVVPQVATQFEASDVVAVFECGGTARTAAMSIEAAPAGAEIVIVGLAHEPVSFIPFDITRRGLSISTSMIYNHPADFSRTIELVAKRTIQPSKVISRRCQFAQLPEALAWAASGAETKVVLEVA
jgi:2-desacetyl-2-hydroxyethyl bacteriochlorophyllide A dehydrogenase